MTDVRMLCPKCNTPLQASTHPTDYWCPNCNKYVPYSEGVVNYSVSHTFHDDDREVPKGFGGNTEFIGGIK